MDKQPSPVTPESIMAAKLAAQIERAEIYAKTGILITDEGFILPVKGPRPHVRAS